MLVRESKPISQVGDVLIQSRNLLKLCAVALSLLINVLIVCINDPPRIVVNDIGEAKAAYRINAELNLKVNQPSAEELPHLLKDEERPKSNFSHFLEQFHLIVPCEHFSLS